MTILQFEKILELKDLLNKRRNKTNKTTIAMLESRGFQSKWLRVRWLGGVGSWKKMRNGKIRMQVAASKSGYEKSKIISISSSNFGYRKTATKKIGYRYAYCCEF